MDFFFQTTDLTNLLMAAGGRASEGEEEVEVYQSKFQIEAITGNVLIYLMLFFYLDH